MCTIISSLGGLETLAIAQVTQNTDCISDPQGRGRGISMQRLIGNYTAFLWCDDLYYLFNNRNTGSTKYAVINGRQFKNERRRQNKFSVFSEAIYHLENVFTSVFVYHNSLI